MRFINVLLTYLLTYLLTTARWSRALGGSPSVIPTAGIYYKLKRLLT